MVSVMPVLNKVGGQRFPYASANTRHAAHHHFLYPLYGGFTDVSGFRPFVIDMVDGTHALGGIYSRFK